MRARMKAGLVGIEMMALTNSRWSIFYFRALFYVLTLYYALHDQWRPIFPFVVAIKWKYNEMNILLRHSFCDVIDIPFLEYSIIMIFALCGPIYPWRYVGICACFDLWNTTWDSNSDSFSGDYRDAVLNWWNNFDIEDARGNRSLCDCNSGF